jgi:hypothetical protein
METSNLTVAEYDLHIKQLLRMPQAICKKVAIALDTSA